MPPRFAYWTIIAGGLPTAFRATEQEELLPTFQRLRDKHPDAEMKWFARGKLWESPEVARAELDRERGGERRPRPASGDRGGAAGDARGRDGAPEADRPRTAGGARKGKDWRPGGEHRDPRQPYKDAKKDRNLRNRAQKFARKFGGDRDPESARGPERDRESQGERPRSQGTWNDRPPREKPHGDPLDRAARGGGSRPTAPRWDDRPPRQDWRDRPRNDRRDERGGPRDRPAAANWDNRAPRERPHGDKLQAPRSGSRPPAPRGDRPQAKGDWRDRPRNDQRDERGTPDRAARSDWNDRPPREKPHGDKLQARSGTRPAGPRGDRPQGRPDWRDRPRSDSRDPRDERGTRDRAPRGDWSDRPPREKPHGDPLSRGGGSSYRDRPKTGSFDKRGGAPFRRDDNRGDFRSRPAAPRGDRPQAKGDWSDRGPKPEWRDRPPREDWRDRAPREKPHGDPMRDDRARPPRAGNDRGAGERAPRPEWRDRPNREKSWNDRPPREKPHGDPLDRAAGGAGKRPFTAKGFGRNQSPSDRPPRPEPDRQPRRDEESGPTPPPRPRDPQELPPGPPERGRLVKKKRS